MTQAIRVDSRFATAYRTAKILGVSKSRTKELVERARHYTGRILTLRDSRTGELVVEGHARRKSAATVARKSSGRDAGAKISATKSKTAKAKR
jgi:hypothetical protein